MALSPGDQLGPYRIVSQLGQGGMGVVYQAHDPRLDRHVAIKLLPPDLTRDETAKQRFLQEAKAASALDHPNICTIYDVGETDDGQLYLVMAHYEGETLKERIARGPLELNDAIDITTQVGEGLAKAHAAGIVHRDIKPANLMVTADGTVKILDFGLAKLAGAEGVTQTGTTVGTVAYMSPEQATGQPVDHRTDIWSLGVVLYEMLAGTPPFQGENLLSLSLAIRESEPLPLTGSRLFAQPVVSRALSKDRAWRYPSVTDLLNELLAPQGAGTEMTPPHPHPPSIAVLPFDDMSSAKDQAYFCEGMAEEIINALTALDGLHVASRTSAFQAKSKNFDIAEIGIRLKVGAVLEGSVRRAGDRLRVTAQLINVSDGYHLWSDRYDRDLDDVFAVQDEIAGAVVEHLRVELLGAEEGPAVTRVTANLEAYQCYVKGRYFRFTRYDAVGAIQWFERAVRHDPGFAEAYASLADAIMVTAVIQILSPQDAHPKARAAAETAVRLGDDLSEAHHAMGRVRFYLDWAWDDAEREFRRALALQPSNVEAYSGYAFFLMCMARPSEALTQLDRALELDPLSVYALAVRGLTLWSAHRYEEAISSCHQALELVPSYALARWYLSWVYVSCERYEEALEQLDSVPPPVSQLSFHLHCRGWILANAGQEDEAVRVLVQLRERGQHNYVAPMGIGNILLALGRLDDGFGELEHAYQEHSAGLTLLQMPFYHAVRSDPRFQALLRKMNFPQAAPDELPS